MTTVILGEPPTEVQQLIERRRRLGLDGHDEVWEGVYHMVPHAHSRRGRLEAEVLRVLGPRCRELGLTLTTAFNLGDSTDSFRVPDFGVHAEPPDALFVPTALIVGEVLSPDDETFQKLPYYRSHGVLELLVVAPETRRVEVHHLQADELGPDSSSQILRLDVTTLTTAIEWP